MAQTEYRMLVRPCKLAVLIPCGADFGPVRAAVRYLSWLWGGRFGWIIPANPDERDERAMRWLDVHRPDVVYLVGLSKEVWWPLVSTACQPMNIATLTAHAGPTSITPFPDNLITCIPKLVLLNREAALCQRPSFYHVRAVDGHPLGPIVEAVFGHFDANWANTAGPPNRQPPISLNQEQGASDFIGTCIRIADANFWGWLDIGSDGLSVNLSHGGEPPPTVVVVAGGDDVALYWNIRSAEDVRGISWILPVPAGAAGDAAVHRQIEAWLDAVIGRSRKRPNACQLVSLTAVRAVVDNLAAAMRPLVAHLGIAYVDAHVPYEALPRVTPRAMECTRAVDVDERDVTLAVPKPDVAQALGDQGNWAVELTRDVRTDLAPGGLVLPRRACLVDVLNVPAPPTLPSRNPPRVGLAETGVTLRTRNRDEVVRFRLPSDEEVLLEVLRNSGIEPKGDEKREAYDRAIKAFGGVRETARASRGRLMRHILRQLQQDKQLTVNEIKQKAKLGKAKLPELLRPQVRKNFLEGISEVAKRVSRQRFEAVWRENNPDDNRLQSLLDHWASRGILRACWRFDCQKGGCGHVVWEETLDLNRAIRCTKCGEVGYMKANAAAAYALAGPIRLAISEGMLPVVLAGEVLRKLSREGFLWLPGVKYDRQEASADIDVLACCDGYLILLECKDLEGKGAGEGTWNQLFDQFTELVAAARQARADIVGVATLVDAFPDWWIQEAMKVADGLGLLLLVLCQTSNLG